ncbi:hypothetical protein DA799_15595 [Lactiplantibacillus plantarum]|nr:hypothetical protein DA799_15595 [Lactiplantibacillus plantarum]
MKLITVITNLTSLLFKKYIQATLLIIGLLLIDLGVLTLLNVGSFLVCSGLSMITVAFLINYEREEVKQ